MKYIITLTATLLLALAGSLVRAQVRSVGEVPADLKMSIEELYRSDMQRAEKYLGGRVRDKQQVLKASYNIGKMMANGRIIYGDAVSRMVARIADTLLKDYPELRSELRFYCVNSPEVNAYATGQGMVFVNLGLVAQAENEAQLAFILSHEIIHYYHSHTLEDLVGAKEKKIQSDQSEKQENLSEFLRQHSRSREMENEADSLGIAMFYSRSPYLKDVTEGVFDVLQYGALPFDDVKFDTTFFNTPHYRLTGCWLDNVAPISSRDNYDDRSSTHPNILTRRRKCAALLRGQGGSEFVTVSREDFLALRRRARIECVRQEVIHGQYARAFYNAWLLRRSDCSEADARLLDHLMAYALYGHAMHKAHGSTVARQDYAEVQGESQQVYYAMHTMTVEQSLLTALRAVWCLHMRFPGQEEYRLMADDLMEQLRFSADKNLGDYLETLPSAIGSDTLAAGKPLSKYDRIRQKRREQAELTPSAYALTDLMTADSTLAPLLARHLSGTADTVPPDTVGANGMLVFNPTCITMDNLTDDMMVSHSYANEQRLTRRLLHVGKRMGMQCVDFSDAGLRRMTSDSQYNDFITLCEWTNEFWLDKGAFSVRHLMQPAMDDLTRRMGAGRLNLTALLNVEHTSNSSPFATMQYPILFPLLLPVIVSGTFTGIEHTALASVTIDARNSKILASQNYSYKLADHNDLVDAMLYDAYSRALRGKVATGFMDRRTTVAVGMNLGLPGLSPMSEGHYAAFTPWLSLEVALKHDLSLAAWARYHEGYSDVTDDDGLPISSDQLTVGLSLRRYTTTDFAPLGPYRSYGLHWVHMKSYFDNNAHNTFGLHLGFGRNYVFFDHLLFNYEITYSYTYGLFRLVYDEKPVHERTPFFDAAMANFLTLRLGLGFLPF